MGKNVLPLLTDPQLDFIAQKLDELTFKKGVVDMIDKPVYRLALGMLQKAVSDDIPDEIKDGLQAALDKVIEKDYPGAGSEAVQEVIEFVESKEFKAKDLVIGLLMILKTALDSI